jgi:hypothetical protein
MKCVAAVSAFYLGVWASPCAFATTVTVEQGQVLLNTGQGYKQIQGPTKANPGDMVVVNPGGMARITFDDGCVAEIQPPSVVTITSQSPCQQQKQLRKSPPARERQGGIEGISATTMMVGGILVGGGVTAAILLSHKDKAASP